MSTSEGRSPAASDGEDAAAGADDGRVAPSDAPIVSIVGYRDQVFPSLEVNAPPVSPDRVALPDAALVLVARNVFSFWPERSDESRDADEALSDDALVSANREALRELHDVSRRRSRAMAEEFVRTRVRRLAKDFAVRTPHDDFAVGTLLISQDVVPTSRRRHARFQWAVTNGRVVELKGVRLPVGHLEAPPLTTELEPEVHVGGDEVATLLAFVLDLMGIVPSRPIAALGSVATHTHEVLVAPDVESFFAAAHEGGVHDVIFARHDRKADGLHEGLCFWPVIDTNEAVFAVLSAVSGDVVNPNLRRRALTKEAYAWASVALVFLAVGIYQLVVAVGGVPPISFGWFIVALVGLFFVGTRLCTHRFWRMDR